MFRRSLLIAAALGLASCAMPAAKPLDGRWVDLSHDLAEDSVFWPTAEGFRHDKVSYGETPGGWFYSSYDIHLSEHGGTHLDAPIHFAEGKQTTDRIPLDQLIGPAAVLDVSNKALGDRDYRASIADLMAWEGRHGRLPPGTILLVRTGYDRFWPDRARYMGTDERGPRAVAKLHFPGIDPELARFLVEQRGVKAVGLDTPSLDYGQSKDFLTHRILLGANVPGFENVAAIGQLPPKGATVVALPIKIRGGSGGPLRIVAFIPR